MKKSKDKIADLVRELCPKFDEVVGTSAVNRISEFLEDLCASLDEAESFIEDAHEGQTGVLLEFWDGASKKWLPTEMIDGGILYCAIDSDAYMGSDLPNGLYANLPGVTGDEFGADWGVRLGVWETHPKNKGEEVFGKVEKRHGFGCEDGSWYRMRIVDLGPFSEKAKKWMRENIGYFKSVIETRCGEV